MNYGPDLFCKCFAIALHKKWSAFAKLSCFQQTRQKWTQSKNMYMHSDRDEGTSLGLVANKVKSKCHWCVNGECRERETASGSCTSSPSSSLPSNCTSRVCCPQLYISSSTHFSSFYRLLGLEFALNRIWFVLREEEESTAIGVVHSLHSARPCEE